MTYLLIRKRELRKFVPASALIADSVDSLGGYGETETVDLIPKRRKRRCDGCWVGKEETHWHAQGAEAVS